MSNYPAGFQEPPTEQDYFRDMTPDDLICDLRSRIHPGFADTIGTESNERKLCVEALETLIAENAARIAERDSLVELLSLVNEEALKVEKERDALKARIDGGIRVKAVKIDVSHDCRNYGPRHPAHNATIILDEGVEL